MSVLTEVLVAGTAGVLSHLCFFIRGEYHVQAPALVRTYMILTATIFFLQLKAFNFGMRDAAMANFLILIAYAGSLFSSMITYRLFFHRLRKFPGPIMARMSKLYHFWNIRHYDQYVFLEKLHQQYGDLVRTGPNEITIFTSEGVAEIYGPDSKCSKAAWYDMMLPLVSMVTTRSKSVHDARRRVWDMGFSVKALQDLEHRVLSHAQQLNIAILNFSDEPVDVTRWFEYFTFDVMGDVSFGLTFEMLKHGRSHAAIEKYQEGIAVLGPMTPVPWLFHIAFSIPGLQRGWRTFRAWANKELQLRLKRKPQKPDSISWMIEDAKAHGGVERNYKWLLGDFITHISGGSEPVLTTLVFLFYHLAQAPAEAEKLRHELEHVDNFSNNRSLQTMEHLNGLINETLRLHPPVPSGGLRNTPLEGLTIDGKFIPGNTTVLIPHYSLGRLESCFERANDFVPERWYSEPQMVKDKRAFIPFSAGTLHYQLILVGQFANHVIGNYMCVGRNLGLMEIRIATALLISKYNITFAPGEDGTNLFKDTKDTFTAAPGHLNLVFQKRP